jgi:hypothetical protein
MLVWIWWQGETSEIKPVIQPIGSHISHRAISVEMCYSQKRLGPKSYVNQSAGEVKENLKLHIYHLPIRLCKLTKFH